MLFALELINKGVYWIHDSHYMSTKIILIKIHDTQSLLPGIIEAYYQRDKSLVTANVARYIDIILGKRLRQRASFLRRLIKGSVNYVAMYQPGVVKYESCMLNYIDRLKFRGKLI